MGVHTKETWRIAASGFLSNFATFGVALNFMLFQEYYQNEIFPNTSTSTLSWLTSTLLCVIHLGDIIVAPSMTKIGPSLVMMLGTTLVTAAWIGSSFVHDFYAICILQGALLGLGSSLAHHPPMRALGASGCSTSRLTSALAKVGSPVGGLAWSLIIPALLRNVSLSWTYRAIGLICFLLLVCSSALAIAPPSEAASDSDDLSTTESITATGRYVILLLAVFFVNLGVAVPLVYLASVWVGVGLSRETAGYVVTVFHAASILGQLLSEFLTGYIGRKYMTLAASAVTGIMLFLWPLMINLSAAVVFAVIYGFFLGIILTENPTSLVDAKRAKDSSNIYNLTGPLPSLGLLVGGPIGGAILDASNGSWLIPAFVAGGTVLFGVFLILVSHARVKN